MHCCLRYVMCMTTMQARPRLLQYNCCHCLAVDCRHSTVASATGVAFSARVSPASKTFETTTSFNRNHLYLAPSSLPSSRLLRTDPPTQSSRRHVRQAHRRSSAVPYPRSPARSLAPTHSSVLSRPRFFNSKRSRSYELRPGPARCSHHFQLRRCHASQARQPIDALPGHPARSTSRGRPAQHRPESTHKGLGHVAQAGG